MEGIVYKSTGSWYIVRDQEGVFWNARIKGKLKIDEDISSTNPIAVGDIAVFDEEDSQEKNGIIREVKDRNNYIVRVSPHNKNQKHIVASNLDQALIVATLADPRTSPGFVDRFLITAEAYHIKALIVINKIDLLKEKHKDQLAVWEDMYGKAGYEVFPVIALEASSVMGLLEKLKNRTTLISGHSGVGKSTLINQLMPGKNIKTNVISGWSGKGQHTTTFAEMYDLDNGGRIIDTPGVKEFGLIDIEKEELAHYFPELKAMVNACRFHNCLHVNEPGCAVKQAVSDGLIAFDRYISYRSILDSIEEKW